MITTNNKYNKEFFFALATFIMLFFIATIAILNSFLALFIAILSAIVYFLQPISLYFSKHKIGSFLRYVIIFIHYSGLIHYLYFFYKLFFQLKDFNFKCFIIFLNSFIVIYSLCSRYYFLNKELNAFTFCFLIVGLMCLYCRSMFNLYIFITTCVLADPKLFNLFEGDEIPPSDQAPQKSKWKSFIDFSRQTTNHNYKEIPPNKLLFSRRVGLVASLVTCGAACSAAYYAKLQADYAKLQTDSAELQAEHAKKQTYEFQRQNDLNCVDKGFMSKETYCKKHTTDCTDFFGKVNFPQEQAARMEGIKSTTNKKQ